MLCDNALLLSTYSRAYRKYRFPLYRKIVEKTVQWLLREMGNPATGFSSSLGADSNGKEGGYYLWERNELEKIMGKKETDRIFSTQKPNSQIDPNEYLPRLQGDGEDPEEEARLEKLLSPRIKKVGNLPGQQKNHRVECSFAQGICRCVHCPEKQRVPEHGLQTG